MKRPEIDYSEDDYVHWSEVQKLQDYADDLEEQIKKLRTALGKVMDNTEHDCWDKALQVLDETNPEFNK